MVFGELDLTPRAKTVLRLAVEEARRFRDTTIGTEHLLLGIVSEAQGIAAGVLEKSGAHLTEVRRRVLVAIEADDQPPGGASPPV